MCKNSFILKNKKNKSNKAGYCGWSCYKKTPEMILQRKSADLLRVDKINKNGGFQKNGKASTYTFAKNYINSINIDTTHLDDSEILNTFKSLYYKNTNHGQAVKNGYNKKYKKDDDKKAFFKNRTFKSACSILKIEYSEHFTEEEKKYILSKAYSKFRNSDPIKWKKTHIKNAKDDVNLNNLTANEINKLYSEYLSERYSSKSLEVINNGYKRTKKGWYSFNNICYKQFYRSSWEELICEKIDEMIRKKEVVSISSPPKILYTFEGRKRAYFPDFYIENLNNKKIILEVKPLRKCDEEINVAKFNAAKNINNHDFIILTEDIIFSEKFEQIIKEV
jgi:hypothetical protein